MEKIAINLFKETSGKKYTVYPDSPWKKEGLTYFTARDLSRKYLGISGKKEDIDGLGFTDPVGNAAEANENISLFGRTGNNLKKLKNIFPTLCPSALKKDTSFGFGDRLGLATPAHTRVIKKQKGILPVFAQQSVRELEKTGRTFKDIVDAAAWNIFQEGYRGRWGADADHIKDKENFTGGMDGGMTMFTLDTSEVLEEPALDLEESRLKEEYDLDSAYIKEVKKRYENKKHMAGGHSLQYDEDIVVRIALAYGRALDFIEEIYHFLNEGMNSFDYEISFDETDAVTSYEAHYFVVNEMHKRGVDFSGIALKFPGTFEKGIDYGGNTRDFEESIKIHGEIARNTGGYKLSLHSGSDKFSVYKAFNKHTKGIFHIKTSGTSWLEAVRVIAACDQDLFREIFEIALDTFKENKKAYHVDLAYDDIRKNIDGADGKELMDLVYDRNIRRAFHIAYGSILERKKKELYKALFDHEEKHYQFIASHLEKHFDALER